MQIGKMPENALKRSVLRQILTKREEVLHDAGIGEDCSVFCFGEGAKIAACMQEAMVTADRETTYGTGKDAVTIGKAIHFFGDKSAADGESASESWDKTVAGKTVRELGGKAADAGEMGCGLGGKEAGAGESACTLDDKMAALGGIVPGFETGERFLTMGDLIQKCANNLAAGGAWPVAATITLLLPVHTEEPQVRALMAAAEEKCSELSMEIAGGQTRITGGVLQPMAVVTAYGRVLRGNGCSVKDARPGQDIVLSKWIGLQGTALTARRHYGKLRERYPAYLVEEAMDFGRYLSVLPEAKIALEQGVCAMHDASEGGIFGALWELAEGAGTGLTIDLRKLPLRQETVEVCECCGVNPYELLSGGCLIMATWDGPGLRQALEKAQIPAALVGKVTDSHDRLLLNGEETRYLDRPRTDSIYGAML